MFVQIDESASLVLEQIREACVMRLRELSMQEARIHAERMELQRAADARGDWQAAGCSSSTQWLAEASCSDFSTAKRITRAGEALRSLPALDEALSTGLLTLDQVSAATPFATPAIDAEIARIAIGKAPSQIAAAARRLAPPKAKDDSQLYAERALSMQWTQGNRVLAIAGRLPLEQGLVFEQTIREIAKQRRAADKQSDSVLGWQQYTADALVSLTEHDGTSSDGVQRRNATVILHLSPDAPPMLEGAGPVSPETAERIACDARHMTIKPHGDDLVHSRVGRCASDAQLRALYHRDEHCRYPGCTATRDLAAHHIVQDAHGGKAVLANMILLCSRHHKHLHDHHVRIDGTVAEPVFARESGRVISANQPHAPPR